MASIMIVMSREDVYQNIPYMLVCETMCGSRWNTGKRRRAWAQQFTESERALCNKLGRQARIWALSKGVPEKVSMSMHTYEMWSRLASFCAAL